MSTVAATAAAAPSSTNNDWMLYVGIGAIVIVAMAGEMDSSELLPQLLEAAVE